MNLNYRATARFHQGQRGWSKPLLGRYNSAIAPLGTKEKMKANFEENLKQLEAIVESLEEGPADLDQALKSFEAGIKLSRACHKELSEAQKRVEVLLKDESGDLSREPLEG